MGQIHMHALRDCRRCVLGRLPVDFWRCLLRMVVIVFRCSEGSGMEGRVSDIRERCVMEGG
jgi:hypothetical protein